MDNASAPDRPNTSIASAGVQTIGSPWMLKLVLRTAPTPHRDCASRNNAANSPGSASRTNCGRHVPSMLTTPASRLLKQLDTVYAIVIARFDGLDQSARTRGASLSSMLGQNG